MALQIVRILPIKNVEVSTFWSPETRFERRGAGEKAKIVQPIGEPVHF